MPRSALAAKSVVTPSKRPRMFAYITMSSVLHTSANAAVTISFVERKLTGSAARSAATIRPGFNFQISLESTTFIEEVRGGPAKANFINSGLQLLNSRYLSSSV